jgi:NADH:ubiquinone oxidoreductase subunit B-like Fe-S oxidoreductase
MVLDGLMKLQDKIQDQHTSGKRSAPEERPPEVTEERLER